MKNSKPHDEAMAELYRKDPEFAKQVINSILENKHGDQSELLIILRQITKAFGDIQAVNYKHGNTLYNDLLQSLKEAKAISKGKATASRRFIYYK